MLSKEILRKSAAGKAEKGSKQFWRVENRTAERTGYFYVRADNSEY